MSVPTITEALIFAAALRVAKLDISLRSAVRETMWGGLCRAAGVPGSNKPQGSQCIVMVAAVKSRATVITGRFGGVPVELMLDSGSSISLVQCDLFARAQDVVQVKAKRPLQLVTASGGRLPVMGHIRALIELGGLKLLHEFVVVESLVAPMILGVDFLHENALVLDFTQSPVVVRHAEPGPQLQPSASLRSDPVKSIYKAERETQARACAIAALEQPGTDVIDECAVPAYHKLPSIELPECPESHLYRVVEEYKDLFYTRPGHSHHW